MANQLSLDSRVSLSLSRFAVETGWDLQLRSDGSGRVLEVFTAGITDAAVRSALSAHRPIDTARVSARSQAISALSNDTLGAAVLTLLGLR